MRRRKIDVPGHKPLRAEAKNNNNGAASGIRTQAALGTDHQKTYGGGRAKYKKKIRARENSMKKNSCTPINSKKYSCKGLKKIHTRNLITKKNSCSSKIPLPPHNFSNGPSLSNNRVHSALHRPFSQFTNGNLVPTTRFHRRLLIIQGSGGAGEPLRALFYTLLRQDESVLLYKPNSINSPIFMLSLS